MNWRKGLCIVSLLGAVIFLVAMQLTPSTTNLMTEVNQQKGTFQLPSLPYAYNALEPAIDAKTVEIHYSRHHKGYVDALNKAIQGTKYQKHTLRELFTQASKLPASILNNAGGHWNHAFYWSILKATQDNPPPSQKLQKLLEEHFGTLENFKNQFRSAGLSQFGSGWAWLIKDPQGKLLITATNNQENPLMDIAQVMGTPLLTCDVWEHAYYLNYLNRRDEYLDAFWSIVDWEQVEKLYNAQ